MTKNFINFDDLSHQELQSIIDRAISLKKEHKSGRHNDTLKNKTLAMIFDKSSTRTRVSFEAGMTQLGGQSLFLSEKDIQLGRGEPITDSAIVISSMVDAVMLRLSSHEDIVEFSKHSSKPVINALSDESHPCQILADLMTYQEEKGSIQGKKKLHGLGMDVMSVKPTCKLQKYLISSYRLQLQLDMSPQNYSHKSTRKTLISLITL
jgi:ornithine carbamoyltransferase